MITADDHPRRGAPGRPLPPLSELPRRRPWRLVSPLGSRTLGDLDRDPIRLWTTQSAEAYDVLVRSGVLAPDPALADPDFTDAYAWLQAEADRRLPTSGPGMLWLYARHERRYLPMLNARARGEVLLQVEMPREHVLLLSGGDWVCVLNSSLLVPLLPGESDDAWWPRAEPLVEDFHDRQAAAWRAGNAAGALVLQRELEDSWRSVFEREQWGRRGTVEAVVHAVHASQVVWARRIR